MFYGRRRGRSLSASLDQAYVEAMKRFNIPIAKGAENTIDLASFFPVKREKLSVEIGFGQGEHLHALALEHPQEGFIGCEPFVNGMAYFLRRVLADKLENVRVSDIDATILLQHFPDAAIDHLYVLFPDPWHKKKHHKRRLISKHNLQLFYQKLKPSGTMLLATDHEDYYLWMQERLAEVGTFDQLNKGKEHEYPAFWVKTRYQQKTMLQGRVPKFILCRK